MGHSIFLSYSRKDRDQARQLYDTLTAAGFNVWFDLQSLLPGQDWEYEVRRPITDANAVIICLSSNWVDNRSYVQKELKLALEVMQQLPDGAVHTIPVRFDECVPPASLSRLHWLDLFKPDSEKKLLAVLSSYRSNKTAVDRSTQNRKEIDAYDEFMEEIIAKGGLIHVDPYTMGLSKNEVKFKELLRGRLTESVDLLRAGRYQEIIELWQALDSNPYFRIDHSEWFDKPLFRCQIHAAKSNLFIAHVQLGVHGDHEHHMTRAFKLLEEVLTANPYSMKGGSEDRLDAKDAEAQNHNYKVTLKFALDWFRGWSGDVMSIWGISAQDCSRLENRVHERMHEIDTLFRIRRIPSSNQPTPPQS